MKKCIVIPDSYKGTLSSIEICGIIETSVHDVFPQCKVVSIPIADGGEGTVDCFVHALGASEISAETTNPFGEKITAQYARIGDTAIIEMASAAGLPQAQGRLNPLKTTTYGVGTLIKHAAAAGCKKIVLGLGGSCTNDGGVGMALALGTVFLDKKGGVFMPGPNTLKEVGYIDNTKTRQLLKDCEIIAMCDIDNPLCGENGASAVFGPQKGADPAMVKILDENLAALAGAIENALGKSVLHLKGAGAAGGMGAGVVGFLDGTLNRGIDTILSLIDFEKTLIGAGLVITGEGRVDFQSKQGKVVYGVAQAAKKQNVPVIAVAGALGEGAEEMYDYGVDAMFSINRQPMAFSDSAPHSKENLRKTMADILKLCKIAQR